MAITVENAVELQAIGVESRRQYRTERARVMQTVKDLQDKIEHIYSVVEVAGKPDVTVMEELARVTKTLHETTPGSLEYTRLVQAHSTLYSLIHPKPGVARPRRTRQPQSLPLPEPAQEPRPSQVPAQPSKDVVPGTTSTMPVPGTNPTTQTQG